MNQQFAQLYKQLQSIWGQLGLNQKITIAATTLAVLIGVGGLAFFSSRTSYSLLYGKMEEAEAAKVVAYLDEAKIPYQVSRATGSITVPSDKVHTTRMQLAAKGIPRGGEGVGFEIFDRSNFGISDFVQRANYVRAVQGELSRTISQLESVESARVMIVMPENRLLVNDKNKPTASVFLKVRSSVALPQQTVMSIRFLVSNAVEGLQASNVSVVDNLGNVLSDSMEPDSAVGMTQSQLEVRKKLESYLAKKVESMLEPVVGQMVVRVAAEMNFDSMTRIEEKFDPEGQVLRISTINDEDISSLNASSNTGTPGVQVNAFGETNTVNNVPQSNNKTKKKVTNSQYEINKVTSNLIQSAGSITRLSAAVFIASKVETTNGVRTIVPRPVAELEKLKKSVESALGIQEGDATRKDQVTLEEFEFSNQPALELAGTMKREESKQFWFQLVQSLIYPVLALALMGLLWRVLKRAPDNGFTLADSDSETANAHAADGMSRTANGKEDSRIGQPGEMTVDVLNQLIKENPQNMTHAIRGWMNQGSTR